MTDGPTIAEHRAWWEKQWRTITDGNPRWRTDGVPPELRQAVEEGWFPAGATVLDIGCGSGELTNWMAEQGLDAVGVDIAPTAIELAERQHASQPRVRFAVLDITSGAPAGAPFDCVLDRGCLHALPEQTLPAYAETLRRVTKPGAPLLLFHTVTDERDAEAVIASVRDLLEPSFRVLNAEENRLKWRRGIVIWLERVGGDTEPA